MQYKAVKDFIQSIINSIESTGVALGNLIRQEFSVLSEKTLDVKVTNPQEEVKVTGKVEVDQSGTEAQLKSTALALRELKNALKPLKEIKVSNFPNFPKFPDFPKTIKVNNLPTDIKVNNIQDVVKEIRTLAKAIDGMELSPKIEVKPTDVKIGAPIVNVPQSPAPVVNVEKPDLSEIKKLTEFFKGITAKKPMAVRLSDGVKYYKALEKMAEIYAGSTFSAFRNLDGSEGRALLDDEGNINVNISAGGDLLLKYRIAEMDDTNNPKYYGFVSPESQWYILRENTTTKSFRYVNGTGTFTTPWADRASHTYKFLYELTWE